jgi:hypothetical protein
VVKVGGWRRAVHGEKDSDWCCQARPDLRELGPSLTRRAVMGGTGQRGGSAGASPSHLKLQVDG